MNSNLGKKQDTCSGTQFASLADFVTYITNCTSMMTAGRFKDIGAWGPLRSSSSWYRFWAAAQNPKGSTYDVGINVILYEGRNIWMGSILGTSSFSVKWRQIGGDIRQGQVGSTKNGLTARYFHNGIVCNLIISGNLTGTMASWANISFGNISSDLKPTIESTATSTTNCDAYSFSGGVTTSGTVYFQNASGSNFSMKNYYIHITISYPI